MVLNTHIHPSNTSKHLSNTLTNYFENVCGVAASPSSYNTHIPQQRLTPHTLTSPGNTELSSSLSSSPQNLSELITFFHPRRHDANHNLHILIMAWSIRTANQCKVVDDKLQDSFCLSSTLLSLGNNHNKKTVKLWGSVLYYEGL